VVQKRKGLFVERGRREQERNVSTLRPSFVVFIFVHLFFGLDHDLEHSALDLRLVRLRQALGRLGHAVEEQVDGVHLGVTVLLLLYVVIVVHVVLVELELGGRVGLLGGRRRGFCRPLHALRYPVQGLVLAVAQDLHVRVQQLVVHAPLVVRVVARHLFHLHSGLGHLVVVIRHVVVRTGRPVRLSVVIHARVVLGRRVFQVQHFLQRIPAQTGQISNRRRTTKTILLYIIYDRTGVMNSTTVCPSRL